MKKWKELTNAQKGEIIGYLAGGFWAAIGIMGVFVCKWDLFKAFSLENACGNNLLLSIVYVPLLICQMIGLIVISLFKGTINIDNVFFMIIIPAAIEIKLFSLLFEGIGLVFDKKSR